MIIILKTLTQSIGRRKYELSTRATRYRRNQTKSNNTVENKIDSPFEMFFT